RHKPRLAI
ncbi:hypothetical protein ECFRIK2001_4705, partial [Escherichia coli FRIK2001]